MPTYFYIRSDESNLYERITDLSDLKSFPSNFYNLASVGVTSFADLTDYQIDQIEKILDGMLLYDGKIRAIFSILVINSMPFINNWFDIQKDVVTNYVKKYFKLEIKG